MLKVFAIIISLLLLISALTYSWLQPDQSEQLKPQQTTAVRVINRLLTPYGIEVLNLDSENISLNQLHIPRLVLQIDDTHLAVQNFKLTLRNGFDVLMNQRLQVDNIIQLSADMLYIDMGSNILTAETQDKDDATNSKIDIAAIASVLPKVNINNTIINLPNINSSKTTKITQVKHSNHSIEIENNNDAQPTPPLIKPVVTIKALSVSNQGHFSANIILNQQPITQIEAQITPELISIQHQLDIAQLQQHLQLLQQYSAQLQQHSQLDFIDTFADALAPVTHLKALAITAQGQWHTTWQYHVLNNELNASHALSNVALNSAEIGHVKLTSDLAISQQYQLNNQLHHLEVNTFNLNGSTHLSALTQYFTNIDNAANIFSQPIVNAKPVTFDVSLIQPVQLVIAPGDDLPTVDASVHFSSSSTSAHVKLSADNAHLALELSNLELANQIISSELNASAEIGAIEIEPLILSSKDATVFPHGQLQGIQLDTNGSASWNISSSAHHISLATIKLALDQLQLNQQGFSLNAGKVELASQQAVTYNTSSDSALFAPPFELTLSNVSASRQTSLAQTTHYRLANADLKSLNAIKFDGIALAEQDTRLHWQLNQLGISRSDKTNQHVPLLQLAHIDLQQKLQWQQQLLKTEETWQVDLIDLSSAHWVSNHQQLTLAGSWEIDEPLDDLVAIWQASQPMPASLELQGHYQARADFVLSKQATESQFQIKAEQKLNQFSGEYLDYFVKQAQVQAQCQFDWQSQFNNQETTSKSQLSCLDAKVNLAQVFAGLNLKTVDVTADISLYRNSQKPLTNWLQQVTGLSESDVKLSASAQMLDGLIAIPDMTLKLHDTSSGYLLLQGVNLATLLNEQPIVGVSGSGIFDGVLPATLHQGVLSIDGGQIAARAPGGLIQVKQNPAMDEMVKTQPQLEIVFQALAHLNYQQLAGSVDMQPNGDAQLTMAIKGSSPEIERPIHLNYTHQENIYPLYKSMMIPSLIETNIEQDVE